MKIVKPDACIISESNHFKQIEKIGRLCYKSEDNITQDSCYRFVENLYKNKHYAMLEHAHAHFYVSPGVRSLTETFQLPEDFTSIPYVVWDKLPDVSNTYLVTVSVSHLYKDKDSSDLMKLLAHEFFSHYSECQNPLDDTKLTNNYKVSYITYNCEYLKEYDMTCIKEEQQATSIDIITRHWFISVKFICDRGVSHELVRHRCSVAQESTRYCNYSSNKFGNELSFVKPVNIQKGTLAYGQWHFACHNAEEMYISMLRDGGIDPQDARSVLPNSLKTEVVLTMSLSQWTHFMQLRMIGTTGKPHPDMKVVASIADNKIHDLLDSIS